MEAEMIARCVVQVLADSQVKFRGGHRSMAQRELYLLQGGVPLACKAGKGTPEIVGCDIEAALVAVVLHDVVNALRRQSPCGDPASFVDGPEYVSVVEVSGLCPAIDGCLYPARNGDRTDATVFADQVGNDPPAVPLLQVSEG